MPFQQFTSEEKLIKNLPPDFLRIHITSLTENENLKSLYIRANVFRKFKLNSCRVPSIKLILQEDDGSAICFHAFGNIATHLDSCSVGIVQDVVIQFGGMMSTVLGLCYDTLFLLEFEAEIAPKQSHLSIRYQLLADERTNKKPIVWLLKNNMDDPPQKRNSMRKAEAPKESYVYTFLNDLKTNEKFNVYGVITHMKEMSQTRSNDKHLMLNITDQSLPNKDSILTCNLFHSDSDKLPAQAQVGDVIRFHRLKIQRFEKKLQGISGPGFHWLCFHGSFDNVSSSSSHYTLETQDKQKVQALFKWSQSNGNEVQTILDAAEPSSDQDYVNISTRAMPSDHVPSTSRGDDDRRSPQKSYKEKSSSYQTLRDSKAGTEVNVFGVVIYMKPLVTTRRLEFHQMMNITDQSLLNKDDKVTCNLFNTNQSKLPYVAEVGDVIRLKDLKVQLFQGKKQGSGNVEWALFRDSSEQPFASSDGFIPNPHEKALVANLRKWWQEGPEYISISQSSPRKYFNVVCQVIGFYLEPNKTCRVIRVWDGTAFSGPILKRTDTEMNHEMRKDSSLETRAGDLATDLFFFDNHANDSMFIEPGDVIKVTNLHANLVSGKVEMTLHGGTKFNKGYVKLDRNNPQAKHLLEALKSFSSKQDESSSPQKRTPSKRYSDEGQPDDGSSPSKKFCRKRNSDERNVLGPSDDSINLSNTNDAELALAKEYDNIPQDAELSQRDRFAIEAFLAKNQTPKKDNSSNVKNSDQAGSSKEVKGDESQNFSSSPQGDRKNSHNDNGNCNKGFDEDCFVVEGISESSSESSPIIWLSLYNSPANFDGLESADESNSIEDSREGSSPSGIKTRTSENTAALNSAYSNDEPSKAHGNISTSKSGSLKMKESLQSAALIKIIGKNDNSNDINNPKMKIQDDIEENIISSQESFITASDGSPPQKSHKSPCVDLAESSTSFVKNSKLLLTLRKNENQPSQESQEVASGLEESDNTISSSLDWLPSKRKGNIEEYEDSEVSSSTESKRNEYLKDSRDTLADDEPLQCMLETVTAVLDHPRVKRSKLSEVIHHKVPHKFKILVRMKDYRPKPKCAGDLVHYCCHICNYMIKASDKRVPTMLNREKNCPKCTAKDSVLRPVIIINFLLSDGKYDLICHLWKSHAVQFFQGMEPLELLANEDCFIEVQHYLDKLCPGDTDFKDKPYMECCIFSYHVKREVHYQMFDTAVV